MEWSLGSAIPGLLWFVAVVLGALVLGLAMAYGAQRYRHRRPEDDAAAERGARRLYRKPTGSD